MGMGAGPISPMLIRDYLAAYDLEPDTEQRVFSILRRVDDEYVRIANEPKGKHGKRDVNEASVADPASTKEIFRNIAARAERKKKPAK